MNLLALCAMLALASIGGAQARSCNASGSLSFGVYDPQSTTDALTIGTVVVSCDGTFGAKLSLGVGSGAGASYPGGRRMTRSGGAETLVYNLYANSSRTLVFGDGTSGSVTRNLSGRKTYNEPVWARIPARQLTVVPGTYLDTVVITIAW